MLIRVTLFSINWISLLPFLQGLFTKLLREVSGHFILFRWLANETRVPNSLLTSHVQDKLLFPEENQILLSSFSVKWSVASPCVFLTSSRIEKSRQIFPAIIQAAEKCPKESVLNWKYFFSLLFTRENLKLVHIGCHVKGEHEGFECQSKYFYMKSKR